MKILTRKFITGNGMRCREILEFEGFDLFPKEGECGCNSKVVMCKTNLGYHAFDDNTGEVIWRSTPDYEVKEYISIPKPSKVKIGGGFGFAGVRIGSTWPEEMFQAIVEDVRKDPHTGCIYDS